VLPSEVEVSIEHRHRPEHDNFPLCPLPPLKQKSYKPQKYTNENHLHVSFILIRDSEPVTDMCSAKQGGKARAEGTGRSGTVAAQKDKNTVFTLR
jgi:hypothetical protein